MKQTDFAMNPRLIKKAIYTCLKAHLVPFIQGQPGISKSEVVKQIAQECNYQFIDIRLSQMDITDLNGIPQLNGTKAQFKPFDLFPLENDPLPQGKHGWLAFLDEANSASRAVQAAAYKLILDRQVGNYNLHPKVYLICAGNREEDNAITTELSTAMTSRLVHLTMESDTQQWLDDYAIPNNISKEIIGFLSYKPNKLNTFNPEESESSYCVPRTWTFVDKLLKTGASIDELTPIIAGTIDAGVAIEFKAFCKLYKDLPKIEDIESNPRTVKVPNALDSKWAIITAITEHVNAQTIEAYCTYLDRFADDSLMILFFRMIVKKNKALLAESAILERLSNYQELLNELREGA